jgi:RNA polymerase sigma-70 factor, ECF subfamily
VEHSEVGVLSMTASVVDAEAGGLGREAILERLRERIRRFAASRVPEDVAEDLAQEVLMLLITKYADKTAVSDLVPLAFRIVRLKMSAYRTKTIRRREHLAIPMDDVADLVESDSTLSRPDEQLQLRELSRRLALAIRQLGDRCRRIFAMKLQGHSFAAIQDAIGADSINSVYTWDARCRRRLLELMGGSWEG